MQMRECVCVRVCVRPRAFARAFVWTTITMHMCFKLARLDFNMRPMAPAQTWF